MSIRTKLLALLAVPLATLVVLAGLGVRWSSDAADRSRAAARHMDMALLNGAAALELSQERGLSVAVAAAPDGGPVSDLAFQRGQTDVALTALRAALAEADGDRRASWDPAGALDDLASLREEVDGGSVGVTQPLLRYTTMVDALLGLEGDRDDLTDLDLATRRSAYEALTEAVDDVALEQSLLVAAFSTGTLDPDTYDRMVGLEASQAVWLDRFESDATAGQRAMVEEALATPSAAAAANLREEALAAGPGGGVDGDPSLWFTSMLRKVELLRAAADTTAADLTATADDRREGAGTRQAIFVGLGLGAVALIVVLVLLLHRIVVRPLRRLTTAAHEVATRSLPHAVEVAQAEGPDAAREAAVPLRAAARDEVGELVDAFNAVQDTAVSLAAEQAALRRNVNDVFLNMGRRTQNLIARQLGHIDHLEASTEDPRALADLFLLDHLATRLRRNAESLLVLAGAASPRPWGRPVSVGSVVRAAVAEATDYSRVDVDRLDPAAVMGAVVSDLSHLVAELVDNALAYSPPTERVVISGWVQGDGRYVVSVADGGIGMTDERMAELNARIAHPPVADLAVSKFFGLFVVGRLATRHDVGVHLTPSPVRGVTAHVTLPLALLVAPDPAAQPGAAPRAFAGAPMAMVPDGRPEA